MVEVVEVTECITRRRWRLMRNRLVYGEIGLGIHLTQQILKT